MDCAQLRAINIQLSFPKCHWQVAVRPTLANLQNIYDNTEFKVMNPRAYESGQTRDDLRRALGCSRLRGDISFFSVRRGDDTCTTIQTVNVQVQKLL